MQNNNYPRDSRNYGDESEENHKGKKDHGGIGRKACPVVGSFDEEFGEGDHEEEETSEEELV